MTTDTGVGACRAGVGGAVWVQKEEEEATFLV